MLQTAPRGSDRKLKKEKKKKTSPKKKLTKTKTAQIFRRKNVVKKSLEKRSAITDKETLTLLGHQ